MKLLIVVNPISGGKNKKVFLEKAEDLCRKYGLDYTYFYTTGEGDIKNLKTEVKKTNPDRVVSVGGDGTTLMTALALQHSETPFGIVPMGSANGMAKELNVPSDPMEAFKDLVLSKIIVPLDVIQVNDAYTIHLGDVGINATLVKNFSEEEGRGWAAYARHFFSAIVNATLFDVSIELDNNRVRHKAYSVIIANTRMYGTGAIINPMGNPHDGIFEIVVILKNDWSGVINLGLTAFDQRATNVLKDYMEIYSTKSATVHFNEPLLLQLDGEVIGKCKKITAEILPGGVKFITTGENFFLNNGAGNLSADGKR